MLRDPDSTPQEDREQSQSVLGSGSRERSGGGHLRGHGLRSVVRPLPGLPKQGRPPPLRRPKGLIAHLVTTIALLTLAAPAASAQEGGVFIDPDSPAGTEYAIPLDQARREAAGGNASPGSAPTGEQSLFGAGITPGRQARPADGGGDARRSRQPAGASRDQNTKPGSNPKSGASASTAAIAAATGDGDSVTLLTAGIAAAVLAVGLAAGLAFRRTLGNP